MLSLTKLITRILSLAIVLAPLATHADLLEIRAAYSVLQSNPKDINDDNGANFPQFKEMNGFSIDALASLPAMPVGVGVRYERFSADKANTTGSFDSEFERTSLLVTKRFIDTGLYAGAVFTIGLANQLNHDETLAGVKTSYKATSAATGSIGVEAGVHLLFLNIGAEAGYLYAPLGNLKYSNGSDVTNVDGSNTKVNLSGPYARAVIGIGF